MQRLNTIYRGRVGARMHPRTFRTPRVKPRHMVTLTGGPLEGHALCMSANNSTTLPFAVRGARGFYLGGAWASLDA